MEVIYDLQQTRMGGSTGVTTQVDHLAMNMPIELLRRWSRSYSSILALTNALNLTNLKGKQNIWLENVAIKE